MLKQVMKKYIASLHFDLYSLCEIALHYRSQREKMQIPQWQHKALFQYDSDADKLGLFLAY